MILKDGSLSFWKHEWNLGPLKNTIMRDLFQLGPDDCEDVIGAIGLTLGMEQALEAVTVTVRKTDEDTWAVTLIDVDFEEILTCEYGIGE